MKKTFDIKVLGIESSCDETAVAVVELRCPSSAKGRCRTSDDAVALSNVVSSQIDIHALTGGVVPEVASRAHVEKIISVVDRALLDAKAKPSQIDAIAVTAYPGLIGSLLVGVNTAKSLALAWGKPVIPINHLEGHIYANFIKVADLRRLDLAYRQAGADKRRNNKFLPISTNFQFPAVILLVSGGHTSLILMKDHGKYVTLGETLDDAAGEAFDKVAKILGLEYPGGPAVSACAEKVKSQKSKVKSEIKDKSLGSGQFFPRPMIDSGDFNFSFSGLKTAVLYAWQKLDSPKRYTLNAKRCFCYEFEEAVVDVLATKTIEAAKKYKAKTVSICGGVAANKRLREEIGLRISDSLPTTNYSLPPLKFCGDNAAMIATAAAFQLTKKSIKQLNKTNFEVVSSKNL